MISGYHAALNAAAVGLGFEVLVFVHLGHGDREQLAAFDQGLAAIPEVIQAERLFGTPDYLLRVVTADLDAHQRLFKDKLATLPNVNQLSSTIVTKRVIASRPTHPSLAAQPTTFPRSHPVRRRPTHRGGGVVHGVQMERATVRTTWTP
ncbi:Lrp/AsnC family transcriptional regulator [Streptomyces sp. NPDC002577]